MTTRSEFSVRQAGAADVDVVERIRADFAEDSGWPRAPLHPVARAAFVRGDPSAVRVWLAEDGAGAAIGFAAAHAASDLFDGPGAWLLDLYVAPAWRRCGVGRTLVEAVAAWTRDAGGVWLVWQTSAANMQSRAFYASLGAVAKPDHLVMALDGETLSRAAAKPRSSA